MTSVRNLESGAELLFSDRTKLLTDAVIGADGYHSVVRRAISPEAPYARYAPRGRKFRSGGR